MAIFLFIWTHNDRKFSGYLSKVSGSGGNVWHLMSDSKYYFGELHLTDRYGWVFIEQRPQFAELADFFGDYLIAWHDGSTK